MRSCRVCGSGNISPSRVKSSDWICSGCANRKRAQNTACYLACKLASVLRKAGVTAPYPGARFAREVYEKCGGASVLSGERHTRRLCIVRVDPQGDWSADNAVLVTSAEAYALSRTTSSQGRRRLLLCGAVKMSNDTGLVESKNSVQ